MPKFGNILTRAEGEFNPVAYAKWNGSEIDMFITDAREYKKEHYINKKIPYKVNLVEIDELHKPFKGYECFSFFPVYEDMQTEESLDRNGVETKAAITDASWHRENEDTTDFYTDYQYHYQVDGENYRSPSLPTSGTTIAIRPNTRLKKKVMKKILFIAAIATLAVACGPSSNQGKKGSGDSAVKGGADTGPDTLQRQSSTDTITNR